MTLRTRLVMGTLAAFAFAIGVVVIARGCDERARKRGEVECRQRGGRFTEMHGRQEGWSCTYPEKEGN